MLNVGWTPGASTYGAIIDGFAKAGQADDAALWVQRMMDAGLKPDVRCFNRLWLCDWLKVVVDR